MAEAIAKGFIAKQTAKPEQIKCYDVNPARVKVFEEFGTKGVNSNQEVVNASDINIICTKPQYVQASLEHIAANTQDGKLKKSIFVSIAAGITISQIETYLSNQCKIARLMPNTPCMVGEMAAGLCTNSKVTQEEADMLQKLFSSVGKVYLMDEKNLNAVTGLSGSGPAYVFQIIEALADGGVRSGLTADVATQLAAQTVFGASKMVLESQKHPGVLKQSVTSPGGTTIAGLYELEKGGVRASLMDAVYAATKRAEELGKS